MIKIKPKSSKKKKQDPYYKLVYYYTIGDADGNTSEEVFLSVDNPYIEKYVLLLDKLSPTKGYWGISLDRYRLIKHCEEGQITDDEYNFLYSLMFKDGLEEDNREYSAEFYEGIRAETEYSFLTFDGVDLFYYDEFGVKHETIIE